MEIELERNSHTIDESAQSLQRDIPQVPPPWWKNYFRLSQIYQISRSPPKVSKGKEKERVTENKRQYPALSLAPKPSTTPRTNQQQPQDLQYNQAFSNQEKTYSFSPREVLDAALKKPVVYPSGFSVLRTESVPHDQKYRDFYDQNDGVQQQLIETLKKLLGIAAAFSLRVEYVVGGMKDRAKTPTILICCADEGQRRKIIDHFRKQSWTMVGFAYSVEVDPVVLASGSVNLESLGGSVVRSHDPVNYETLCGLACEVLAEKDRDASNSLSLAHPLARLTLGGLICVDNRTLYALTTAHSFIEGADSDHASSNTTDSDSVFFGKMYQLEYLDRLVSPTSEQKPPRTNWAWDWALVRVDQSAYYKPNSFQPQFPEAPRVYIECHLTVEELSDGEVWVCSASKGPRIAMLYADRTLMAIGNLTFEARLIGLAEELVDGDSGSWVVRDGKLCGYIYSRILHRPWAYMLPIDPVFQEISRVLSHTSEEGVSVEVATRAEIQEGRGTELRFGLSIGTIGDKIDSTEISMSKPSDTKMALSSSLDPPKNDRELSKDTKGERDRSTTFNPDPIYMVSGSKAYRSSDIETKFPSISDPEKKVSNLAPVSSRDKNEITRDTMANSLPRLIRFLVASFNSYQIDNMINEPHVTEKARQLFQRVKMQDTFCRDLVRNLVTTYGDSKALTLLKDSSDGKLLSDAAEIIMQKLTRTMGMRKTEFVFEILASIDKRLRALHNGVESIAETFQKRAFMRMFLGLIFTTNMPEIEKLLIGLELSNNQLHCLLFEPALHQSVQQICIKKNLSNCELQLELYRSLSEVHAKFEAINPVVFLGMLYPTTKVDATMIQYGRQQLSIFCRPKEIMREDWEDRLSNGTRESTEKRSWKNPKMWAPHEFKLDRDSWWNCEIEQKNGSVGGMDRVNGISFLAHMLKNDTGASTSSKTPISFEGNAHHMLLYKDPVIKAAPTLSNMAQFFEDERQKRVLHPLKVSSSRFIGFALKLSYSILKLYSTPWVELDWTWENILVTRDKDDLDAEPEVFIVHKLHSADEAVDRTLRWTGVETSKWEDSLTRLGFALVELAFRRRLDAYDDANLLKTALQLSGTGQIAVREGQIYGDVVRACLTHSYHSGSEIKIIDSDRPDFQDAVREAILSPLHALWLSMRNAQDRKPEVKNLPLPTKEKAQEGESQNRSTKRPMVKSQRKSRRGTQGANRLGTL